MGFSFAGVPKHWFYGSVFVSHVANALNLLFPDGERFFIRSVRHYLDRIDDPELRARVRGFFGQEGSHGHEHERAFEVLKEQGFEIDTFLRWYRRLAYDVLEPRFPPNLRLSVTVALEHFTATLAERAFATDDFEHAHPAMRDLLLWHAAEEIEHKSVAFDVLQEVDPRYWVRVVGLVVAVAALMGFWRAGTKMLLDQDPEATPERLRVERKEARKRGQGNWFLLGAIAAYLRLGFHPDQIENHHLARTYLESIGRLAA